MTERQAERLLIGALIGCAIITIANDVRAIRGHVESLDVDPLSIEGLKRRAIERAIDKAMGG